METPRSVIWNGASERGYAQCSRGDRGKPADVCVCVCVCV